jgi:hypothetical protein
LLTTRGSEAISSNYARRIGSIFRFIVHGYWFLVKDKDKEKGKECGYKIKVVVSQ